MRYDIEDIEKTYLKGKAVLDRLNEKKLVLEKNRFTIQTPDGNIPERYRNSFSRLEM